jgi:hypothetical protein
MSTTWLALNAILIVVINLRLHIMTTCRIHSLIMMSNSINTLTLLVQCRLLLKFLMIATIVLQSGRLKCLVSQVI